MNSVESARFQNSVGFTDNFRFSVVCMHCKHRLSIDFIHTITLQSGLCRISNYNSKILSFQPVFENSCRFFVQFHTCIAFRIFTKCNSSRKSQSWCELHHIIIRADIQSLYHLHTQFLPSWAQHSFTHFCQNPMTLAGVHILFFAHDLGFFGNALYSF